MSVERLHSGTSVTFVKLWALPLVVLLNGCWAGRLLSERDLAYRHAAVRWVYRTGGQIGNEFVFIAPIKNYVYDLQIGKNCILVTEGPFGCMEGGPWRPTFALDLETGKFVPAKPLRKKYTFKGGSWKEKEGALCQINRDVAIREPLSGDEIMIGKPGAPLSSYVPLLRLAKNKRFGSALVGLHAVFPDKDTLVLGEFQGYVICVDLGRIPEMHEETPASVRAQ